MMGRAEVVLDNATQNSHFAFCQAIDGDALGDGQEVNDYHTNPLNPDSDNDSIWDGDEVSIGTNPLASDTDGGGISDGDEIMLGTNPLNPEDDFILQ